MFPFHKTLACVAVSAVAFAAFALAAVEAGQLHEQVLDQLERKLAEQFVGQIDARRLTGTLLWGFTAHDIEIRDGRGEPVAHVDEFQVEASVFEMLDGNFRFDRARILRPLVLLEQYADGTNNVNEVFKSRRPRSRARPAGQVLFEMKDAQVVDGQLFHTAPAEPTPSKALAYLGAKMNGEQEVMRVTSARAIDVEGSLRVMSGKQTELVIDRLDADVSPSPGSHQQPRHLNVQRARLDSDAGASVLSFDTLTLDDHWLIEDVRITRDSKYVSDRLSLRSRASSPSGGWLQVAADIDCDDAAYDLLVEAEDFKPADWPGAPDWSWLVLDGVGELSGRGWSRDDMDATLRWTSSDMTLAGEHIDQLGLVAHVADQRVDVEALDVAAGEFSASAKGHLSEDGAFALDLDANTNGAFAKRLARRFGTGKLGGIGRVGTELRDVARLELSTKATGALDMAGRAAMQRLEHASANTTWKAQDVVLDDTRWGVAGGSFGVRVPTAPRSGRAKRRLNYNGSIVLHDVHHRSLGADVMRASMHGDAVVGAEAGLEGLSYNLEIDGDGLKFGEHRAKEARLNLSGALSPSATDGAWPLDALAAEGTLDLVGYRSDDLRAKRVATNIDVSGPFPVGEGTIVAHMTGLRTNDRRFRHARMELRLLEDQRFRFKSKARVEVSLIPDLPIYLDIHGRHGRDLKALSLDKFTLGRPGMRWKMPEPGLVHFTDGAVVLKSLTLKRHSQRVRLDGDYGRGKTGSISAICKRLASAQLRSFFDLSAIF
jgi:hypothetical protein